MDPLVQAALRVTASLNGVPIPGEWRTIEGFDRDTDVNQFRPASMREWQASAGPPGQRADGSISRRYDPSRDDIVGWDELINTGVLVIRAVFIQPITFVEVPGSARVYRGILGNVTAPEGDIEGDDYADVTLACKGATLTRG